MRMTTTVLAVLAAFSINSQAGVVDHQDRLNQHFSAKRAHNAAPIKEVYRADDKWEGATLQMISAPSNTSAQLEKTKTQLNLHFLARRNM